MPWLAGIEISGSDTRGHDLGDIGLTASKEYIYVRAGASIDEGAVVRFADDFVALELTTGNAETGVFAGVAVHDVALNQYFWAQVRGLAKVLATGSCAAFSNLYTSDVSGYVDDATDDFSISNIYTTEVAGALGGLTSASLIIPVVSTPVSGGGGGGGGGDAEATHADPVLFYANWEDKENIAGDDFADSGIDLMEIASADIRINNGGWTVETESNVSSVVVPEDGTYNVGMHIFLSGAGGRNSPAARISRTRGNAVVYGIVATGSYLRGSGTFAQDSSSIVFSQPWELEEGDKVTVQVIRRASNSLDIDGDQSWIFFEKMFGEVSVTGGGGGSDGVSHLNATGGLVRASAANEGKVAIDRNTLLEYICVERFHYTSKATGDWADIPTRSDLSIVDDRSEVTAVDDDWIYEQVDDQFYAGTIIAPNRVGWVQDVPDNALADSLVTVTDTVHWLGEHEADGSVLALLDTLADNTEYFYVNLHSETIRRLDNDSFVAAGSPLPYYVWLPVRADPRVSHAGFVVDVTEEHHPPPAGPGNFRNIYIDRSLTPPRVWVPHEGGAPDTAPSLTFTHVDSGDADFRGVAYVNPDTSAAGDWYYNRNNHTWRYRSTSSSHFVSISFAELKRVAMDGADAFFNSTDVFLNEVNGRALAAQIIQNAGYDSDKDYYWIQGQCFSEAECLYGGGDEPDSA